MNAPATDIRDAASVVLVRERGEGPALEVYLVRRHRKAGFMASSFVFPGGVAEAGDGGDARVTASRELFEEAGVLLCDPPVPAELAATWRAHLNGRAASGVAGEPRGGLDASAERSLSQLLADRGSALTVGTLHELAHWITPSIERRRYSARFFVARLPPGQSPSPDQRETTDEVWVTPDEALARAGELRLPPPQVRTFGDIRAAAARGYEALVDLCAERTRAPHPILPRMAPRAGGGFWLLLPWDPEYESAGTGDARPMPADHPLAVGPSRFELTEDGWRNVNPPR